MKRIDKPITIRKNPLTFKCRFCQQDIPKSGVSREARNAKCCAKCFGDFCSTG